MDKVSKNPDKPVSQKNEDDAYSGTCFWCGLCSKTNGICVRNHQELIKSLKNNS